MGDFSKSFLKQVNIYFSTTSGDIGAFFPAIVFDLSWVYLLGTSGANWELHKYTIDFIYCILSNLSPSWLDRLFGTWD